jgi:hypothetical protein
MSKIATAATALTIAGGFYLGISAYHDSSEIAPAHNQARAAQTLGDTALATEWTIRANELQNDRNHNLIAGGIDLAAALSFGYIAIATRHDDEKNEQPLPEPDDNQPDLE